MAEYKQIEVPLQASGLSAPEVRKQCAAKDLMFNVGFYDNSEEDDWKKLNFQSVFEFNEFTGINRNYYEYYIFSYNYRMK